MSSRRTFITVVLAMMVGLAGCAKPSPPPPASTGQQGEPGQQGKPGDQLPPAPPVAKDPAATLVFAGDLMLTRTPGEAIAMGEDPIASVAQVLKQADLTVGNLECVIATVGQRVPKAYNFRCHPRNVPLLARYFSAVSVANNHSGDFGKDAFAEQLTLLKQGGVPYFGGGMNATEAHTPLIVERSGMKIALLGYNEVELRSYEAAADTPGLAWSDDARVVADIKTARGKADLVIPYMHWGLDYRFQASERQRSLARLMIDAGADMVIGSHPHVTQPPEYYKGKLIAYSLGNFVFDDYKDVGPDLNEPSRTSWLLRITVNRSGMVKWDTIVTRTDDSGIPRPVRNASSPCGSASSPQIGQCTGD